MTLPPPNSGAGSAGRAPIREVSICATVPCFVVKVRGSGSLSTVDSETRTAPTKVGLTEHRFAISRSLHRDHSSSERAR